jgi:hypothetical protein
VRVRTWYIYEQNVFILEHFFASEAFAHWNILHTPCRQSGLTVSICGSNVPSQVN